MVNYIKNFIKNLVDTLHNQPGGFSARKLTALATMLLVIYLHFKYVDSTNLLSVLAYDMVFILLLLSIITFDQLYKFKLGTDVNTPVKPEDVKEATEPKVDAGKSDIV